MEHEVFEKIVMDKILDSYEEPFVTLKKQYLSSSIISRKFTGCGFFTDFAIPDELIVKGMGGLVMDVVAKFEDSDMVYLFILFVREGKIDCLEGVTGFGDWDYNYDKAIIQYEFDDRRYHEITGY